MSQGQVCTEARSRGQSNHKALHTHLVYLNSPAQATASALGLPPWPCPGASRLSLPRGRLPPMRCTPSWLGRRIPRSICHSCRGNRALRMGPSLSPLRSLPPDCWRSRPASQPPSCSALPSPKAVHCSVPASHCALPRWAGPHHACLPPASSTARLFPARGPRGGAHSPGSQPRHQRRVRQGQGARASPQDPEHHLSSDSPLQPRS